MRIVVTTAWHGTCEWACVAHPLITAETLSRLDQHRVAMRVLVTAVAERARQSGDVELLSLVERLAKVNDERGHLLEGVMEALAEDG